MTDKTVTRAGLAQAVYEAIHEAGGLSRAESAGLVKAAIDETVAALVRGEDVKIAGFGSLALRDKGVRPGRNPRIGAAMPVPARRVAVLRPSGKLKARMNAAPGRARPKRPGSGAG